MHIIYICGYKYLYIYHLSISISIFTWPQLPTILWCGGARLQLSSQPAPSRSHSPFVLFLSCRVQ